VKIECSSIPSRNDCKMGCEVVLECGHRCKKKCCEPCSREDCAELVLTSEVNICNHKIAVPCKDLHACMYISMQYTCSKSCLFINWPDYFLVSWRHSDGSPQGPALEQLCRSLRCSFDLSTSVPGQLRFLFQRSRSPRVSTGLRTDFGLWSQVQH